MYRLKSAVSRTKPAGSVTKFILTDALMRQHAREWHRANPEFALEALRSLGRCKNDAEAMEAQRWQTEALDIGFWTKKDIVQYPLACLHAKGSLVSVPTIRQFFDRFTEADKDIMQQMIDVMPIHYWTYLRNKTSQREEK